MKTFTFTSGLDRVIRHFEEVNKKYKKVTGKDYFYVIGITETKWVDMFGNTKPTSMFTDDMYDVYTRKVTTYQVSYQDGIFSQGYELIGLIDYKEDPVLVISMKEGYDLTSMIEKYTTFNCACCKSTRRRNKAFIVEKDGKIEVVGSKCVKEFVGINPSMFSNFAMFAAKLDDPDHLRDLDHFSFYPVSVNMIIRASAYFIKRGGYVKSGEIESTVDQVKRIINSQMSTDSDVQAEIREVLSQKVDIEAVKEFWMNKVATNDFMSNIQRLIENGDMSEKWVGIACYIYEGYRRELEVVEETPEYEVGHSLPEGRQEMTLTSILFEKSFEGGFGWWTIVKYLTDTNHVVTYKGGTPIDHDFVDPITVKASVTHSEYGDDKFNKISRIKVLETA